ncbi:amino-acid oxidase [Purpureocillium lavendulum]|uniref:Amino-acid oxidase n=1 Tax=Purpureocillium lavendulum TaxID=1247861 RepID=A0AB34FQT1_9HYPO|nr:amino-acid oxidase [Purpureocillium lavendulum]
MHGRSEKLTLRWRRDYTDDFEQGHSNYAVIAAPFSVACRRRRATPTTPYYLSACEVALEYEARFWELLEDPIYASCP